MNQKHVSQKTFSPIPLLLSGLLLSSFVACSRETPSSSTPETPSQSQTTPDPFDEVSPTTNNQTASQGTIPVNLALLTQPTGMGAAQLMENNHAENTLNNYDITLLSSQDQVISMLENGSCDIASLSPSMAAKVYNQGTDITVLAVNSLGGLLLLEKATDSITKVEDLRGETIWATGENDDAEYILQKLLQSVGMELGTDVFIQWMTASEVSQKLRNEERGLALLPVLEASIELSQNEAVTQVFQCSTEWSRLVSSSLPMGCFVVRNEFLEEYPQTVEQFLADYQESHLVMSEEDSYEETAQFLLNSGITSNLEVAMTALPKADFVFYTQSSMKSLLQSYYLVLFQTNPDALGGGGLPYDDFYYLSDSMSESPS